jgi:DUF1680 family protein
MPIARAVAVTLALSRMSAISDAMQDYPIRPVPFTSVKLTDDFWRPKLDTNQNATVKVCFQRCEETGRIDNFSKAAHWIDGAFRGIRYDDSDVYKVIEGASYSLALNSDPALDRYLDLVIDKIAGAQEKDGYLYTCRTIDPDHPAPDAGAHRWENLVSSHELYNVGHLYEAAVAHFQATHKRALLEVAIKNANLIAMTFGPNKRRDVPGHEEIEIGLIKLYRVTGDARYLSLAKFFIDQRGHADGHKLYGEYAQDHIPVIDQTEPVGHAVRAGYLYSGMADVAAMTNERNYISALDKIWNNLVTKKIYLTGGMGAEAGHEGFGADYFLPNRSTYNETCAAVALSLWNERMFLLHGDSSYLDLFEKVIYNGFLSGVSRHGDTFFYPNPLEADTRVTRHPWFGTACCPVNVVRFLPSITGAIYAQRHDEVFVNLYADSTARFSVNRQQIEFKQETRYPWDGHIKMTVTPENPARFTIHLRIPGWARGEPMPGGLYHYMDTSDARPTLRLNDGPPQSIGVSGTPPELSMDHGFVAITHDWRSGDVLQLDLPMPIRRIGADPRVEADVNRVALQRGPLVYCFEGIDNSGNALNLRLSDKASLKADFREGLLGGVTVIESEEAASQPRLMAIPYYAWNNRGNAEMSVWVQRDGHP